MRSGLLVCRHLVRWICCSAVVLSAPTAWTQGQSDCLPWEIWSDLGEIARLRLDHRVVMRSSRCPDGCAYDRHSDGDERFIRRFGDEGVIFELEGAGAITRIWMTQGESAISHPLDENIRLRLTLDGAVDPVIDLPLPAVFGAVAPFTAPLAVDREDSSGGNVNYVPMAFRQGCRLSLVGAESARIWFQITGHRLASPDGITSFTGDEDLSEWRALLASPGTDPWADGATHPTISGATTLGPGEIEVLADLVGPDSLTALRLDVARERWNEVELVLDFDGERCAEMMLADFFAVGRAGSEATRSLLIGAGEPNELYSYFPMPFFRTARVTIRLAESALEPVDLDFVVRRRGRIPPADSGVFGAQLRVVEMSILGRDSVIAQLRGPGRWVGLFLEAGSIGTQVQLFLEGDERVHADGSRHPALYGTGVEDFFGGGFYYRIDSMVSTPFRRALHGMTYDLSDATGRAMGMYRLMLTDAPVFGASLEVGLEGGPVNQTPVRLRAVSYFYSRPTPPMRRRDLLDLGDPDSRLAHLYAWNGDQQCSDLDGLFEDEPPTRLVAGECTRGEGAASFVLRGLQRAQQVFLRRRFDAAEGDQRATVVVEGATAVPLTFEDANPHRRWRERVTLLERWYGADSELDLSVDVPPPPIPDLIEFSESRWELWAGYPPGTCDLILDGVCDAADVAETVRTADGGPETDELSLTVLATFD